MNPAASLRMQLDSLPVEIDEIERRIVQLEIERQALLQGNRRAFQGAAGTARSRTGRAARGIQRAQGALAGGKRRHRATSASSRNRSSSSRRKSSATSAAGELAQVAEIRYGKLAAGRARTGRGAEAPRRSAERTAAC